MTDPGPQLGHTNPSEIEVSFDDNDLSQEHSVLLSAERLTTATEWVQSSHVRLRRRIVSETRTVEVEVRREELVIDTRDLVPGTVEGSYRGRALDGRAVSGPVALTVAPLVVLLREEIPEVVMRAQTYERVTVDVVVVEEAAVWHDTVRHEEAVAQTSPII